MDIKVGDNLKYSGGYVVEGDSICVGDTFELIDIEETNCNTFYWIENNKSNLVLINDEIENFERVI